jgi:hypothetical protein
VAFHRAVITDKFADTVAEQLLLFTEGKLHGVTSLGEESMLAMGTDKNIQSLLFYSHGNSPRLPVMNETAKKLKLSTDELLTTANSTF